MENKNDKQSFEEKHPKLNLLLGLGILIGLVCLGIKILRFLIIEAIAVVEKVISTLGKLDAVIIVALITAGVSIFTSVVAKVIESRNKRRDYLAQKRENHMESLLK